MKLNAVTSILAWAAATAQALDYPDNSPPAGVDVWCGKAYRATAAPFTTLVDRGWTFPPTRSAQPLLEFTCRPRLKPYIAGAGDTSFVVEARISHEVGMPLPASLQPEQLRQVFVSISTSNGTSLVSGVPVALSNSSAELSVPLDQLAASSTPYAITCAAAVSESGELLASASSELFMLPPNPYGGSTVQLDSLTDQLVVTKAVSAGVDNLPASFFPVGYFTAWGGYLEGNKTRLQEIKDAGYTLVHPVPGAGNASEGWGSFDAITGFMRDAAEVGLWVMYDMRHTYQDAAQLDAHLNAIRGLPSLLLWYTADEPDGNNDPTNATRAAYDVLNAGDGYHPVSLVLNCQNYFFAQYASGADIVSPDIYPVGNNVTFSSVYDTPCNRTYGVCGCDNCKGTLGDLGDRVLEFRALMRWQGMYKALWATGQALGDEMFWTRYPTEEETVTMAKDAVQRGGASGLLWWMLPTQEQVANGTAKVAEWVNGLKARVTDEKDSAGEKAKEGKKRDNDGQNEAAKKKRAAARKMLEKAKRKVGRKPQRAAAREEL